MQNLHRIWLNAIVFPLKPTLKPRTIKEPLLSQGGRKLWKSIKQLLSSFIQTTTLTLSTEAESLVRPPYTIAKQRFSLDVAAEKPGPAIKGDFLELPFAFKSECWTPSHQVVGSPLFVLQVSNAGKGWKRAISWKAYWEWRIAIRTVVFISVAVCSAM